MKVINTEKKPIKMWLDDLEEGALEQAKNLANLPFAYKHIAILPDSHQGYGMPIGSVLATKNVVIPNSVGVDIGCGMQACKTSLTCLDKNTIKKIMGGSKEFKGGIRSRVPVGRDKQSKKQDDWLMEEILSSFDNKSIVKQEYSASLKQLGTLGGGKDDCFQIEYKQC